MRIVKPLVFTLWLVLFGFFDSIGQDSSTHMLNMEGRITARNALMATDNFEGNDYIANVQSIIATASIAYKNIGFHAQATAATDVFHNDLLERDAVTNKTSKWELELYDLSNPTRRNLFGRLDEAYFYLKHEKDSSPWMIQTRLGAQGIRNMMLNPRDGRIVPYTFGGLTLNARYANRVEFDLGAITHVSQRASMEWQDWSTAFGSANNGFRSDGTRADYSDLRSDVVNYNIIRFNLDSMKRYNLELGNYNLLESQEQRSIQSTYVLQFIKRKGFVYGIQAIAQRSDDEIIDSNYFPEKQSYTVSVQTGLNTESKTILLAYTHVTKHGRFIFPRELGREAFFTSIARSWVDGYSNAHIATVRTNFRPIPHALATGIDGTIVWQPGTYEYKYNKYRLTPYMQFNGHLRWTPHGKFESLDINIILVHRRNLPNISADRSIYFQASNYNQVQCQISYDLWGKK